MKWSQTFIPTLRDDPSEAESVSHRLMLRAGLIRKLMSGVYSYLPLGFRSLFKAMTIVREEMNRAGAQEILMPVLHPAELWQETGRFEAYGDLMCKFNDRQGRINVLGPTHEEIVTHLVRSEINSYRQLPVTLYQIQVKFRDELRPRFGVIRSREFIMKDAYSFDASVEGMNASYEKQYQAYHTIFKRAGLKFMAVEADSGLIGGDASHEFMVPSPSGEDIIVLCEACSYAANTEKADCAGTMTPPAGGKSQHKEVATPGKKTVEQVAGFLNITPAQLIKTLIYKCNGKDFVAVLVRGDHEVNESKLTRTLKAEKLDLASAEEILKATGGPLGFSGPVGLHLKMVRDPATTGLSNFVTGANKNDTHLTGVNWGNIEWKATDVTADVRRVVSGDPCPKCRKPLTFKNSIEVGHVFKLGTKYSAKMNAVYLDDKGQSHAMVMGCYGIGVNRIVASAIENSNDKDGILWPKEIAPYHVLMISINPKDAEIAKVSETIYHDLTSAGMEVLWDDRDMTAGAKFKDADLIGIPVRVTVGSKTLKEKTVDVKSRKKQAQRTVPISEVLKTVQEEWQHYDEV